MGTKTEFEKTLKITKFWFKIAGLTILPTNPNTTSLKNKFINNVLYYFNIIWLHTDVAGELFNYIKAVDLGLNLIELSPIAPCTAISILSTIKLSFLYYNQETLKSAVNKLRVIHADDDDIDYDGDKHIDQVNETENDNVKDKLDAVERKIVKDASKMIQTTLTILKIPCFVLMLCFAVFPIVLMVYSFRTTGKYEYKFPFLAKYFFEVNSNVRWFFVYLHQVWSMLIVFANTFSSDTLFIIVCILIKMHFEILNHRFKSFVNPDSANETRENLKKLIIFHQELIELVKQMEIVISNAILIQIVFSSFLLCLSLFNTTFSEDITTSIIFGSFLVVMLAQILALSYYGDLLMTSSTRIRDGVYECLWYKADKTVKKDTLFVLLRTQTPCKISAGGFADLKLTTFTSILSTSWSYFALLRTMYN